MKVRWTDKADRELFELISYVYPRNRQTALKLLNIARQKVLQLGRFPNSGRIGRLEGTREFVVRDTPYIVVYDA